MPQTTTDYLDFKAGGENFDLVLTVAGTTGFGQIIAISGTAKSAAASIDNSFEGADNTVTLTYPFVDANGISFQAGGVEYNLYGPNAPADIISSDNLLFNVAVQDLTLAVCYLRGTGIATPDGEAAVEDLKPGSEVVTYSGSRKKIVWVGARKVLVSPRRRDYSAPVIIRRGALGENMPFRDLHVTGGHSILIEGFLVPAEFLVNHRSIVWDDRGQEIEIFHVELEDHDILVANGAPAESYRDDGNRTLFATANGTLRTTPMEPYAPVLTGGPQVDEIWRKLLERSGRSLHRPTTTEADVHILVDGVRVDLVRRGDGWHTCSLPAAVPSLTIASRAAAQDDLGLTRDPRVLGVALRCIVLWKGAETTLIEAAEMEGLQGFHGYEAEIGCTWTNGGGMLPTSMLRGVDRIDIQVIHTTTYLASEKISNAA